MNRIFVSIIIVAATICGLLVFMATQETSQAVMLPSDLAKAGPQTHLTRIRVGGRIADAPIEHTLEPTSLLKFSVRDPAGGTDVIPVSYNGLKPDMFTPGRDVIIDGEYVGGTLIASKLLTQCPSKYEPPTPEEFMKKRESSGNPPLPQ